MLDSILYWNQVALDAAKTDYSTDDPAKNPSPQQMGPTRTSWALAIVHLAMYDAYVGIKGGSKYLTYSSTETPGSSNLQAAQAAVAAAACLTLLTMFSRQKDIFLKEHETFIAMLPGNDPEIAKGLAWGTLVARKMLEARKNDGSEADRNNAFYAPSTEPGRHRPDPFNSGQGFLGPLWGNVKPFGINNLNTVVPGVDPPAPGSPTYKADFDQVLAMGRAQGSTRTNDQTTKGIFWAYDGPRNLGVPPRLYNQVVRAITIKNNTSEKDNAKLLAMVNVAMADAGIQAWYEKYKYNIWRPVVGVREADAGWGPTGLGDGSSGVNATTGDPYWVPLGAPATNQPQKGAGTPPFPAYPSGHATFGTAALRITTLALGLADTFEFKFVSDEFDGVAVGSSGVRPRHDRTMTIAEAIEENVLSRVYLGVHWLFDGREGQQNGELIAQKIALKFPKLA
jgi:Vanadium chloroperoxidase N-terminal domain/PAP2 superfamily